MSARTGLGAVVVYATLRATANSWITPTITGNLLEEHGGDSQCRVARRPIFYH